jgi:primosomal protein N' (replication factor Y)
VRWAEIILPFAGPSFYTYGVGAELEGSLAAGCAVEVQFGAGGRKIVGGIVLRVHDEKPSFPTKPVLRLLFPEPIVSHGQMRLWEWMSQYYMCSLGEVMVAALPAMLKPSGFSREEFADDEFRARRVRMVELAPTLREVTAFNEVCETLRRRAPKQYDALVEIAAHGGGPIPRSGLQADAAALAALNKKELIVLSEQESAPPARTSHHAPAPLLPQLSPAQQTALDGLRTALRKHKTALLMGVPSSGKSEVCFHAIAGTLARGKDVLLLLPEIALTTQFVRRVRRVFGPDVVVYHSALSDRRRAETYIRMSRSGGGTLVVGVRSAIFLPLPRLGLVVVDEEQDASYKQEDPAPRYNARDAAMILARGGGAHVILASATPSLETWANATGGKYGLVELTERWGGSLPPSVTISDTIRAVKRGERKSHFNKELLDRIGQVLGRGEQVILFQNRRGVAPFIECTDCGHVPRCGHCAIPMSVHRGTLRCHYCGASKPLPSLCPSCGSMNLVTRGFGTEKIEEELARLFPSARIARLDRDSAASESAFRRIIGDFEARATDILVGTQMVTKGLDFDGVSLVGVLNADNLVNHPDFRASERAYSLIAQVAGRAGRREQRGEVVIQTASPESRLIAQAAAGDYRAMAAEMLAERAAYGYPPYSRLVSVMLRHADREILDAAAARLGSMLRPVFGDRLLGPQPPVTEKVKGEYALLFLLKVPRTESMSSVRESLHSASAALLADPANRRVTLSFNADPV